MYSMYGGFFTIECVFKRNARWVAVLDVVIRPPSDSLPIKRNSHISVIDDLEELESVFLTKTEWKKNKIMYKNIISRQICL